MKKKLVLGVLLSLLLSSTARADITSQLSTAEEILGIDNSSMKTVERVGALEEELGLESSGTLAERVAEIEKQLGISEEETELIALPGETEAETDSGLQDSTDPAIAPTDEYVIERLRLIPTIVDIAAVTEDHDPNGNLNKPRGYIGCIYFQDSQVDRSEIYIEEGKDGVIDVGTDGGGAVEIYNNAQDAEIRKEYLSSYDGTILSNGSHEIIGTCLVRTSDYLTASQQKDLTEKIFTVLQAEDPSTVEFPAEEAPAEEMSAEEATVEGAVTTESASETTEYVLYDQDGYTLTITGYNGDGLNEKKLGMRFQNLTHHDINVMERDSYVNGQMINLGIYFDVASGKTMTQDCYIWGTDLKNAGITQIEDISFSLIISEAKDYYTLAELGPFNISIDANGKISNKVVYKRSNNCLKCTTYDNSDC